VEMLVKLHSDDKIVEAWRLEELATHDVGLG
jgi:hypothetical protein